MTRKSLLSLFNGHRRHHHHHNSNTLTTFSANMMEENILTSESIISKWHLSSPFSIITPLFYGDRADAEQFCRAVHDLQRAMVFFSSPDCTESPKTRSQALVRAQNLMQSAMKRLEKEFHQILSANRDRLDPESVSHRSSRWSISDPELKDENRYADGESIGQVQRASEIAMADLKMIAQTMISAGYGRECVKIYITMRKSIVDEGLYRLGFENLTLPQIQRLDWTVVDLKISSWLVGARIAIRTLFSGERILGDHVFEGSDSIRESCFAEISKDSAMQFIAFPELVARSKKSPEKIHRILDLYTSLSDLFVDIESVFSFESTAIVRSQAQSIISNLADAVRSTIAEFETAIHKDGSKIAVSGGGVHPHTRYVMNYISLLTDHDLALSDIFADFAINISFPLPGSFFDSSTLQSPLDSSSASSSLSIRIAWLILALLCKLDGKAEIFREASLSYLFLANNLQFIIKKVRSSRLISILGEEWATKHEAKARHYASSYERLAWSSVAEAIPLAAESSPETAAEGIRVFYAAFEEAVSAQREWVVEDERMREEMRESVAEMIVPLYRGFYEAYRRPINDDVAAVVRYAPEDVRTRVRELFRAGGMHPGSGIGFASGSGSGSSKSWWSFSTHG